MFHFFRRIRRMLFTSGKGKGYLGYALGEIGLVVIGILIALQINNWNEHQKKRNDFRQSILAVAEDIRNDTSIISTYLKEWESQKTGTDLLIPILESKEKLIPDSLAFIKAYENLAMSPVMDLDKETWDNLRNSGMLAAFGDPQITSLLQSYFHDYIISAENYRESPHLSRLEMRRLKYSLFEHDEHQKFFLTETPTVPSPKTYKAILEDSRVLDASRFINHSAIINIEIFKDIIKQAENILYQIDQKYDED